ncbi:MAG: hypothetical protein JXB47_08065 [Anaerolineae bacterium]|nr:hypothetical protein [Anaerolineae bacterium]
MRENPERLTWLILLSAFGTFCAFCAGTILFTRWFVLESTTPLAVELSVSRNTVGVLVEGHAEETERGSRLLDGPVTLTTDSTSQALLTFRDPYTGQVLTTFTLFRDSVVKIHRTSRPRFETSALPFTVEVIGQRGHADVVIAPDLDRDVHFRVFTVYDTTIDMDQAGYYSIALGGDYIGVTTRAGEAVMRYREDQVRRVPVAQRGVVPGPTLEQPIVVEPAEINLVYNSSFLLYEPTVEAGVVPLPAGWGCYNDQEELNEPRGQTIRDSLEGRPVLHIVRQGQWLNHAETGCRQPYPDIDLSAFSYLELRAVFYIKSQSISTCGVEGSECPVMLRIKYKDQDDELREWIHGFYTQYTVPAWPLTCQTCRQDHDRINPGVWYTYESGNLVDILPDEVKMQTLVEMRFYASGHAYEVMVDELSLLAAP